VSTTVAITLHINKLHEIGTIGEGRGWSGVWALEDGHGEGKISSAANLDSRLMTFLPNTSSPGGKNRAPQKLKIYQTARLATLLGKQKTKPEYFREKEYSK
jgi:hypothetical protein